MRSNYFIIFFSIGLLSCQSFNNASKKKEKVETIELEFEIITDKISMEEIKKITNFREKINAYKNLEILASLKQTNKTSEKIKLYTFSTHENFEIIDTQLKSKDTLINHYHYQILIDPDSFEPFGYIEVEPEGFIADTFNIVNEFNFFQSDPDTFLIRIKETYLEKELYSNWDTLILN